MMISFKKMCINDINRVIYWIRQDHVSEYWYSAQNVTDEMLYQKYIKRLKKDDFETFIIYAKNLEIGLIQTYYIDVDNPFGLIERAKGLDLFIGEIKFTNKGFGSQIIIEFLKSYIFNDLSVLYACIDPEVANEKAIHVYEKIGFKSTRINYDEESKLLTCYMILKREDFFDYIS